MEEIDCVISSFCDIYLLVKTRVRVKVTICLLDFTSFFDRKIGTLFLNRYMLQFTWMCTGKVTIFASLLQLNINTTVLHRFKFFHIYTLITRAQCPFFLIHSPSTHHHPCTTVSSLLQLLFLQIWYAVALGAEQLLNARFEVLFIDRHARGGGTELCASGEEEVECMIRMGGKL